MNELRIIRGGDIALYIGEEQLFGVTGFYARAVSQRHPIREYLSGEPHALVGGGTSYEIRMSVLSLFRSGVADEDGFSIRVDDGETSYEYEDCAVLERIRDIKAGKNVVDEFVISAKTMRKQVHENAG